MILALQPLHGIALHMCCSRMPLDARGSSGGLFVAWHMLVSSLPSRSFVRPRKRRPDKAGGARLRFVLA